MKLKRVLSLVVTACMISGACAVNAENYEDYIPGELPVNLVPVDGSNSPVRTYISKMVRNSSKVQGTNQLTDKVWSGNAAMWNKSVLWTQQDITKNIQHGFTGWTFKTITYNPEKTYVFMLKQVRRRKEAFEYEQKVNNVDTILSYAPKDTEVRIGLALTNEVSNGLTTTYSKEYGSEGMLLTDEYQEFKATIKPSEHFKSTTTNSMVIGFPAGTFAGATMEIGVNTPDAVYIAEEEPYKITNKKISAEKTLTLENESEFEAEVLNQIGLTGYLNQELEWNVLNSENEIVTDSFNITTDGNSAYVTVKETTKSGKYKVVATAKEYDMSQSVTIDVYVPKFEYKVYVDDNGDDQNAGTAESPLKTLQGARDKVRALKAEYPDYKYTVIFDEGTYYIDKKVSFSSSDSGMEDATVTYKAEEGEKVTFTGAIELNLSDAKAVADKNILKRLYPEVRDKVKVIDLRKAGFPYELSGEEKHTLESGTMLSGFEYVDIYMNDTLQPIAQWPNGDGEYDVFYMPVSTKSFKYSSATPSRWSEAKDWWVGGYPVRDYLYARYYVAQLNPDKKTLVLDTPSTNQFELGTTNISKRWKAFNLLEEIDVPGEWYIDRANMLLYYYMPEGSQKLEISALKDSMIDIRNAEYITFENLEFTKTRDTVIETKDVKNIIFDRCKIYDVSSHGIYMTGSEKAETDKNYWQRQNIDAAYDCKITNSVFYNVGGTALNIDGGNVDTLRAGNNIAENNIFYNCAKNAKYSNTVSVNGCGNIVRNNNISKLPFQAINTMGNDHVIEYNEIYEICKEADDCGAIYSGRNTVARGVEVRYNYIHDMRAVEKYPLGHRPVIYWDDSQTGQYVHHNIIKNADIDIYTAGVDNRFEFNTSVDVDKSMYFKNGSAARNTTEEGEGFGGYILNEELYYSKYENLENIIENFGSEELASLSRLKGNLGVNIGVTDIGDKVTAEDNVILTECEDFKDAKNQDFRIVEGTETYNRAGGVLDTSFDIEKIGVVTDINIPKETFKTISPEKGAVLEDYSSVHFSWDEAFGASFYRIIISDTSDFSNIIYDEEVYYSGITLTDVLKKGKYYWKVIAINTSREFAGEWETGISEFSCGEDISVKDFTCSENNGIIDISATLLNETDGLIDKKAYVAIYDADNRLKSVSSKKISLLKDEADEIAVSIKKDDSLYKAVIYVWDEDNTPVILKKHLYFVND